MTAKALQGNGPISETGARVNAVLFQNSAYGGNCQGELHRRE